MKITRHEENGKVVLAVEGWLDTPSAADLAKAIDETGNVKSLILDFDGVQYLCSSGLRAVLAGYKKITQAGGEFSVVNVNDAVMEVFRLTGFADSLHITDQNHGKKEKGSDNGCKE